MPPAEEWPGITQLPLYNDFEHVIKQGETYKPVPLEELVKGLDEKGIDLLDKMLQCNPANRITQNPQLPNNFKELKLITTVDHNNHKIKILLYNKKSCSQNFLINSFISHLLTNRKTNLVLTKQNNSYLQFLIDLVFF